MKKFLEIIKNKWLIKGTTTLLLVLIVIGVYVALNFLVEKVNVDDLDFTENKLYTLSDESKTKLKELDDNVTITLINMQNYSTITDYIEKYKNVSDKIKIEKVEDLSSRIDLKTKYNISDTDELMVVSCGDREKTLTTSDLYTYDYTSYKQIDLTEEKVTNAIVEVSLDKKPLIYIYSGKTYYNTKEVLSTVISKLEDEANDIQYLDILTKGEVPEDCDCLVITTLKEDMTEFERDKIIEYIQRGGKILLLTSQNIIKEDTPNFDQVLAQYGVKINLGAIYEQDSSRMLSSYPEFPISTVNASFMDNINMDLKLCVVDAGNIEFEDEEILENLGVEYEAIAETSNKSFVRTDFTISSYTRTSSDSEQGAFVVGADVTKTIDENIKSELIVYSSEFAASDMTVPVGGYYVYAVGLYNNQDIILNSVAHLTERNDTITIRKNSETENYTVTEQEDNIIRIIIFTIPVIIIVIGIVVMIVRKRRR